MEQHDAELSGLNKPLEGKTCQGVVPDISSGVIKAGDLIPGFRVELTEDGEKVSVFTLQQEDGRTVNIEMVIRNPSMEALKKLVANNMVIDKNDRRITALVKSIIKKYFPDRLKDVESKLDKSNEKSCESAIPLTILKV